MRRAARLARDEWPSPRIAARYRTRLTGLVTRYGRREGDPFAPASNSSEAVVLKPSLTPRVAEPRALASGSQRRSRPQNRGLEAHRLQGNVAGNALSLVGRPRLAGAWPRAAPLAVCARNPRPAGKSSS